MLKQSLVSQLYINYITKNYLINGLLFQDQSLKFPNFSAPDSGLFQSLKIKRYISGLFGTHGNPGIMKIIIILLPS